MKAMLLSLAAIVALCGTAGVQAHERDGWHQRGHHDSRPRAEGKGHWQDGSRHWRERYWDVRDSRWHERRWSGERHRGDAHHQRHYRSYAPVPQALVPYARMPRTLGRPGYGAYRSHPRAYHGYGQPGYARPVYSRPGTGGHVTLRF